MLQWCTSTQLLYRSWMFKICFSSDPLCVPDKIPFFTQDMSSAAPESLCQLDIMVIDYMFTSKNVSSENSFFFSLFDNETYVGHGLVLDWLNRENFVQWIQKWCQLSYTLLKKINRLKVNFSFALQWLLYLVTYG